MTIVQQAQNYTDVYRILAEYIDNSIDSAEELFDFTTDSYSRDIEITVTKSGSRKKNRLLTISDNACGMKISLNGEYTIFKSDKKEDPSTNGMYGMGMFSFLSICDKMTVDTREISSQYSYNFEICRKIFDTPNGTFPEYEVKSAKVSENDLSSWTTITLSEFHSGKYEEIDLETLKKEIETHFELILKRKNIKITFQESRKILNAEPYDYSKISATNYSKNILKLHKTHSKRFNSKTEFDISDSPCTIFLVVSSSMEINRDPVFINKGRRIIEISKVDQFRSNNRSSIWSNPNITGYITVTGILDPTPTRKDFRNTNKLKAFFKTLNELEPEIRKFIEDETKIDLSDKLNRIEEQINSAVNDYLKDSMKKMSKYKEFYSSVDSNYTDSTSSGGNKKTSTNKSNSSSKSKPKVKKVDIELPEKELISTGITIKIDNTNSPQTNASGDPLRSIFRDSTIIIYRNHADFQSRMPQSMKGNYKFEEKIIQYISMEIITHINSELETATKENKYVKFVTDVYDLEGYLSKLKGQKI